MQTTNILTAIGITLLSEMLVALLWCWRAKKPTRNILLTGLAGNILTQMGLWGLLLFLWRPYWLVLLSAETGIWIVEGVLLKALPVNQLTWAEALRLSLWMNLTSFGIGLVLPI